MGDGLPVGAVYAFTSVTPPAGSMLCDGSAISRTTYPVLYALLGTVYGSGDGATTFNIPDLRSRFVLGSGQGSGLTNRIIAATGGEENHVLVIAELASHSHGLGGHTHLGVDHLHDLQNHYHYCSGVDHLHGLGGHVHASGGPAAINYGTTSPGYQFYQCTSQNTGGPNTGSNAADRSLAFNSGGPGPNNTGAADRGLTTGGPSTGSDGTGSGSGHNNIPPYVVLAYMIKVAAGSGPSNQAPLADTTQPGLMRQLTGAVTDYVGGDNNCHPVPQAGASAGFISKSAAYTLLSGDSGKYILCTGTGWTLTLPIAAPTLCYYVRNDQGLVANGTITIAAQAGSTIDGATSINILPGQECTILSNGSVWRSFGLRREIILGTQDIVTSTANSVVLLPVGYRYFELIWTNLNATATPDTNHLGCYLSKDGGASWPTATYYYQAIYNSNISTPVAGGSSAGTTLGYLAWWIGGPSVPGGYSICRMLLNPGRANMYPTYITDNGSFSASNNYPDRASHYGLFTGFYGPVNAIQYFITSGNIANSFLTVKGVL